MALHNAQHGGQTQTGSLARCFGRVKRVENLVEVFRRDAGSSIGYCQKNIRTRLGPGVIRENVRPDRCSRVEVEPPAFGHGVARR